MEKVLKGIKNSFGKIGTAYKKLSEKDARIDTIVTISGVMLFAFLVMFTCQKIMGVNAVSIATNKAEASFFDGDYDAAIAEYEKLQEDEEWPIYTVKIAEIYSVKGDYEKSNSLLEESYQKRNELIDEHGKSKYNDVDGELGNLIALTFLMNGEKEKALEHGEMFMEENALDKSIQRTMFTIYMVNGQREKANNIIKEYDVDEESSYDLALYARMNMLVDNWDKGYDILKDAWYKNKDEIKVYDVIAQISSYDRDSVIMKLSELSEANPDEVCYKVWLAKCYSMLEETTNEANTLVQELEGKDVGNVVFKTIIAKIDQHLGNNEEAEKILNAVIENDENSYFGYHTAAWYYFDLGDYDKAFELCKQSILENKDYPDNYGFLIPEIMIAKEQSEIAEPYLRMAIEKEPFNYNILLKIADYYSYNTQDKGKAYEYYNLASLVKPNDAEILYNMANIKVEDGKNSEAIELLKQCTKLDEQSTKYFRTLGTVYLNEGKTDEAIAAIRSAYSVDKSDLKTLNNAGVFYIAMEGEIERGMVNIKAAYDGLTNSVDTETRNVISENYQKAKTLYDAYNKEDGSKLTVPDFTLFY